MASLAQPEPLTDQTPSAARPHGAWTRVAVRPWRDLEAPGEVARWDRLAEQASEPNPFYESWFLLPSLRLFDPANDVSLLCLEADGHLVGLLPLKRERRYYGHPLPHWSNWLHANVFLGAPLIAKGFEPAFWRELLAWSDRHARGALFLHLAQMPGEGPLHGALAQTLAATGRAAATVTREQRALLQSRLDPDAYLEQSLSGKKRKELRRQHRRLADEGLLVVERTDGTDGLDQWTDEFLVLEQAGWKGAAGSALACNAATEALFGAALRGAAGQGRLERLAIRLDGKPLAMLASFIRPPGAFAFKTAFDERFARYSPGVLLQRENLALLQRNDIAWTDSCASANHPMIDHFWRERRTIVRYNIAIGGTARRMLFSALTRYETGSGSKGIA